MTEPKPVRKLSPTMKLVLDFGPILAFFLGYALFKGRVFSINGTEYSGFVAVTAMFVPLLVATTLISWRLTGKLSKMNLMTLVLVVLFGGLTIWFNDERFFKMKPTMIYAIFAFILLAGLARGKSYLAMVMDEVLPMQPAGWMILTRRLCIFFAVLAVSNELIWRNFSTDTWVTFKTFGLTLGVFGFFLFQGKLFETYALQQKDGPDE
ncbi:inner membrane-spanning protein YciB [Frigidibacter sp. ROC022]|uniref:inner membrane-spanning protein YciB n=1 Tax=Frigidibacter sp. ROC022 TaxID=2971796 RepID=UPI00215ADD0C|nr:inner membrane-spanning protein YciB [Frigidibacter sp. ROC022]MCR8725326.1 septation protein IspZ [Frigidibacter sp. ROC022]